MKSSLLLISAIAVATAGLGVSGNALASRPDAQAQAAALLSPSHAPVSESARDQGDASSPTAAVDAQSHAAALLSGVRAERKAGASERATESRAAGTSRDAQAQAAALLSGSRSTVSEGTRTTATREKLGVHPAVAVAQGWGTRGIDPNTFIVAHPAGLQLDAASPSEKEAQLARAKQTASMEVAGR